MQRIGKITTQEGRKLQVNKVKRFFLLIFIENSSDYLSSWNYDLDSQYKSFMFRVIFED